MAVATTVETPFCHSGCPTTQVFVNPTQTPQVFSLLSDDRKFADRPKNNLRLIAAPLPAMRDVPGASSTVRPVGMPRFSQARTSEPTGNSAMDLRLHHPQGPRGEKPQQVALRHHFCSIGRSHRITFQQQKSYLDADTLLASYCHSLPALGVKSRTPHMQPHDPRLPPAHTPTDAAAFGNKPAALYAAAACLAQDQYRTWPCLVMVTCRLVSSVLA